MRIRSFWIPVYCLLTCARGASAQSGFVRVPDETPRVEISVGAGAMERGPGHDFERQFAALGFDQADGRISTPHTAPPSPVPGVFAQVHVAASAHAMVGFIVSDVQTETEGRAADGGAAFMRATMVTQALVVSVRPNSWFKFGAGAALHRRGAGFTGGPEFREDAVGWVASGEAKFARGKRSSSPRFGYAIVQYREAPPLSVPAMTARITGRTNVTVLNWPPQTVRTSHWMFGVGIGLEI